MRKFIIMLQQLVEEVKILTEAVEALEERLEAVEIKRKGGRPPKVLTKDAEDLNA